MDLKYDNIAISGGIGVGTTTLLRNLKPYLGPFGFQFKSMGQIIRDQMNEHKNPVADLMSDDFDRNVEQSMHDTFQNEKKWIIEAWLAAFMARGLPNTLKILLYCSQDAIRIDRIVNREGVSVEEAKKLIKHREDENLTKWHRLYGDHNFWDPKDFDLVIDTYSSGP